MPNDTQENNTPGAIKGIVQSNLRGILESSNPSAEKLFEEKLWALSKNIVTILYTFPNESPSDVESYNQQILSLQLNPEQAVEISKMFEETFRYLPDKSFLQILERPLLGTAEKETINQFESEQNDSATLDVSDIRTTDITGDIPLCPIELEN